jgi:hypothetical protein
MILKRNMGSSEVFLYQYDSCIGRDVVTRVYAAEEPVSVRYVFDRWGLVMF